MDSEIRSGIGDRVGDGIGRGAGGEIGDEIGGGIGDGIGDGLSSGIGGGKLDIYCCQHVRSSLRLIETAPASLMNNSAKPLPQRCISKQTQECSVEFDEIAHQAM